jgi:uncharacterized protein
MTEDVEKDGESQPEEKPAEESAVEPEKSEGAIEDKEDKPDVPASIEQAAEEKVAEELDWPPEGEITKDQRTFAMLAWLLAAVAWWLGPLIIYLVKKDEGKFVAFHGLQALFFSIFTTVLLVVSGVLVMCWIGALFAPLVWLGHIVVSIIWCLKANNGEWTELPVIAEWAKKSVVDKAE